MRIFFSLLLIVGTLSLSAQTTTTTKTHRTTASNVHTNNGKVDSHSSTSQTKYSYKFSADFRDYKEQDIKEVLMSHLDDQDLTLKNGIYAYQLENTNGVFFTCTLAGNTLQLNLDKTIAPAGYLSKVEDLCDDLVAVVSSHPSMPYQGYDPQLYQRSGSGGNGTELEQAKRELAAAQRKVERLTIKEQQKRKN